MTPSRLAATLRSIAAKIDASKKPSKILVARELKRVVRSITAAGEISFSGTIKSRFDGENNSAEGTIIINGAIHQITVNSSSSGRGADYELDGNLVDWDSTEHESLDNYFTNIWPEDEGSWDAEVQNGRVSPVVPAEDEE